MLKTRNYGFSLVEIMVVVAIIAIITAIAIPNMQRARINANHSAAQSTLMSLSAASESYSAATGNYPGAISDLTSADPPYYPNDPVAISPKNGYTYATSFLANGYSFEATPYAVGSTGEWNYRITTGGVLKRKADPPLGTGNWEDF